MSATNQNEEDEPLPDEADEPMAQRFKQACFTFWSRFYNLIKAIVVRILLSSALFIITWRGAAVNGAEFPSSTDDITTGVSKGRYLDGNATTTDSNKEPWFVYWMPALGVVILIPEFLVSWFFNAGHEYKWWSPALAVYISCSLIAFWVIQIDLYVLKWNGLAKHPKATSFEQMEDVFPPEKFGHISGFDFGGVELRAYEWARILEQMFFLAIIIAKWLSPKGVMTRDQLSQLLLIYVAMATDILDMSESLMYVGIGDHLSYVILIMFTLNFTATRSRAARIATTKEERQPTVFHKVSSKACLCLYSDMWAMFVAICLQDGPFLIVRLYVIFGLRIITFGNVFFTVKNGISLVMDFYRVICLILDECRDGADADSEEIVQRKVNKRTVMKNNETDEADEVVDCNRAEVSLTITAESTVKALAEFVMVKSSDIFNIGRLVSSSDSDGVEELRVKRKQWRKLRSTMTHLYRDDDDDDLHLLYEVDILLEDDAAEIYSKGNISDAKPVHIKDVFLKNIVLEKLTKEEDAALTRIQHSAVLRHRFNQIVPVQDEPVDEPAAQIAAESSKPQSGKSNGHAKLGRQPSNPLETAIPGSTTVEPYEPEVVPIVRVAVKTPPVTKMPSPPPQPVLPPPRVVKPGSPADPEPESRPPTWEKPAEQELWLAPGTSIRQNNKDSRDPSSNPPAKTTPEQQDLRKEQSPEPGPWSMELVRDEHWAIDLVKVD